jgi:hypothetical protein
MISYEKCYLDDPLFHFISQKYFRNFAAKKEFDIKKEMYK